jgi:hypothetical protein
LFIKVKPDIQMGNGYLAGLVAKIFRIPSIQFGDDPEAKDYKLKKFTATELYYANIRVHDCEKLNAPKEWAYLSPSYYFPNEIILKKIGQKKKEYYFIREVSTGTLNYQDQDKNQVLAIANKINSQYQIVLSLEDKTKKHLYPSNWIILEEPVTDIHSIIYYCRGLFSTGDSMAREAALLGVSAYYCGSRIMKANQMVEMDAELNQISALDIPSTIDILDKKNVSLQGQELIREKLNATFDDVNMVMLELLEKHLK